MLFFTQNSVMFDFLFAAAAPSITSELARCRRLLAANDAVSTQTAILLLNKIIDENPTHLGALIYRGKLHRDTELYQSDWKAELRDLNQILHLQPYLRKALIRRSELYSRHGKYEEALPDLNKLLLKEPNSEPCLRARNKVYWKLNKHDEAFADLNTILLMIPHDVTCLFYRSQMYHDRNDINNALIDLNTLLSMESENINAKVYRQCLIRRRKIFHTQQNLVDELVDLNTILSMQRNYYGSGDYFECAIRRFDINYAQNGLQSALLADLNMIISANTTAHSSYYLMSLERRYKIYYQLGMMDEALQDLNLILKQAEQLSVEQLMIRSQISKAQGNYSQAILDDHQIYKHTLSNGHEIPKLQTICKWTFFHHESIICAKGNVYRHHPDKVRSVLVDQDITPLTLATMQKKLNGGGQQMITKTIFNQLDQIDTERVFQRSGSSL